MSIDRIDWHSGSETFSKDLPEKAGGIHIGFFIAWIINNDLASEDLLKDSSISISKIKNRNITGLDFLINQCDGKFWESDLNEKGQKFAGEYYLSGKYFGDFIDVLINDLPSPYHVENSWQNYDLLVHKIDKAYKKWNAKQNKKWWQFWK